MAGNKIADTVRIAVGSKREAVEKGFGAGRRFVSNGYDAARRYAATGYDAARQYGNRSYEAGRQYTKSGVDFAARMGTNLNELARKQPAIAMATVLAVGYAATYMVRRISTPATPPKRGWRSVRRR